MSVYKSILSISVKVTPIAIHLTLHAVHKDTIIGTTVTSECIVGLIEDSLLVAACMSTEFWREIPMFIGEHFAT